MKIILLMSLLVIGVSTIDAKGHHWMTHHSRTTISPAPSKAQVSPPSGVANDKMSYHEMTNRMLPPDVRRRAQQPSAGTTQKKRQAQDERDYLLHHKTISADDAADEKARRSLHRYVIEHNINKKQLDDEKGIPMEQEHLIHVTPIPPKVKDMKKPKKATSKTTVLASTPTTVTTATGKTTRTHHNYKHVTPVAVAPRTHLKKSSENKNQTKPTKGHKYPKKYVRKQHSLKKHMKKEKNADKLKEKREKRIKKVKALHQAKEKA